MKLRRRNKGIARILSLGTWRTGLSSLFFLVAALLLFMFSSLRPAGFDGVRAGASDMLAPVLATINRPFQAATDYVRTLSGLQALQIENENLRQENARLRDWYQSALVLQSENDSLHKLLHIQLPPGKNFITARVVADAGNAYVKTVLVQAGSHDGVRKGQAVLAGDGLSGRIIETGHTTARVLLLTDINSRVPVLVEGSADNAILAGSNGDTPTLIHLPPNTTVHEGARIISSGQGGYIPFGLPIGVTFKTADGHWAVRLFADPEHANFVRIVDNGDDPAPNGDELP